MKMNLQSHSPVLNRTGFRAILVIATLLVGLTSSCGGKDKPPVIRCVETPVFTQLKLHFLPHGEWWMIGIWIAAALMGLLFMANPKRPQLQKWVVVAGVLFGLLQALSIGWQRVCGWKFWLVVLVVTFSATAAAFIAKIAKPFLSVAKGGVKLVKGAEGLASGLTGKKAGHGHDAHGAHGKEESGEGNPVLLTVLALLAGLVIVATFFGGELPENWWDDWAKLSLYQNWIVVLRGFGLVLAAVGLGFGIWDAVHASWVCGAPGCETRNWNGLQDPEARCNECGAWNSRVKWHCEAKHGGKVCGHKNPLRARRCRHCGAPNPHIDAQGHPVAARDHAHHEEAPKAALCWTVTGYQVLPPGLPLPEGWVKLTPEQIAALPAEIRQKLGATAPAVVPGTPGPTQQPRCDSTGGAVCRALPDNAGETFCTVCGNSLTPAQGGTPPAAPAGRRRAKDRLR